MGAPSAGLEVMETSGGMDLRTPMEEVGEEAKMV